MDLTGIGVLGRAKVYTMRGKYKQLFLRVLDDGQHVCQPANLKVTPERTLEIFVEDVSWISCPMAYLYREPPYRKTY